MGGVRWSFWLVKRGQGRAGLHPRLAPHVVVLAVRPRRSAVSASHWQPSPGRGAAGGLTVGTTGMRQHRHLPFGTGREVVRPCLRHPCPAFLGFCCHQPAPFLKRGARFRKGAPVVCLLGMGLLCVGSPTSPPLEHPVLASVPRPRDTTAGRMFLATAESRITSHPGGS